MLVRWLRHRLAGHDVRRHYVDSPTVWYCRTCGVGRKRGRLW